MVGSRFWLRSTVIGLNPARPEKKYHEIFYSHENNPIARCKAGAGCEQSKIICEIHSENGRMVCYRNK